MRHLAVEMHTISSACFAFEGNEPELQHCSHIFWGGKNEVEITYPVSSEKGSSPSKPGSSLTMVCEATMPGKTNRTRTIKHIELTKPLLWNKFLAILAFCGAITRRNLHTKWTRSHFWCNIFHFNTMLP